MPQPTYRILVADDDEMIRTVHAEFVRGFGYEVEIASDGIEAIAKIEQELVREAFARYDLESGTLFFDTTNFFTYIASTNRRCTIAQRGKNKQKRYDLRQTGLALVVTQEDMIPVFHLTYQGNLNDTKVFASVLGRVKQRLLDLGMELETHTFVFDRGNNSKKKSAS